ncbi:MAG: AMP-binding protein [Verrucomicrobia bacterium]|nr:AMP-binding protein [Verrucomicrobiota bacterium]
MESPYLTNASDFWGEIEKNTVLLNPRLPDAVELSVSLEAAANNAADIRGHVVFATSGTTGSPKFACLSHAALLASAKAVNDHLRVSDSDHWFCPLPTYHVGGIGIWARAHVSSVPVAMLRGKWNPLALVDQVTAVGATLTSMVPTQIHDLVLGWHRCPDSLRAVLVGGGALLPDLRRRAEDLGWPILETFGMTEAASQIATEQLRPYSTKGCGAMVVLPIWKVRLSPLGILEISGTALFSGYLEGCHDNGGLTYRSALSPDGWFTTSDRVELAEGGTRLIPKSRVDSMVKILGENVDTKAVERALRTFDIETVIVALPDRRTGNRLVAVIDADAATTIKNFEEGVAAYNRAAAPSERVNWLAIVPIIPITELGKVADHQVISALLYADNFRILK